MNAEQYLGVPWAAGGRELAVGLDCWGLLCHIYYSDFGILLPPYNVPAGSLADPFDVRYSELQNNTWIELTSPAVGDVVLLGRGNSFSHVGVYVETPEPSIIHSARDSLSCIASLKLLTRYGYNKVKFYHHVDRLIH